VKTEEIWRNFFRKVKKEQLILVLLFGVLLVVIAIPSKSEKTEEAEDSLFSLEPEKTADNSGYDELEEKLSYTLAQVEGVGKTQVVLTYDNKEERVLPSVQGVLIIAQGGDNPVVIENIREAVLALFPVDAHKIKVMKMK
jgi:stage III sporulation protein AG